MIHSVAPKGALTDIPNRAHEPAEVVVRQLRAANAHPDSEQAQPGPLDRVALDRAAARVSTVLESTDSRLKIEVDDEAERVVITVLEQDSGKVIRQIPPEELLQLEKYLSGSKGLLLHEQA